MRTLFRTGLAVSAMTIALPTVAPAQTTAAFDGTYGGVSIQGSGGRTCTAAGPAPRPLPQMYLGYNDDGYLIAMAPYNQPVGPGFWERNS